MNRSLVTVAKFPSANEAEAARAALEAAGIRAYLQSAELVAMAWHLSNAVGDVQLQVDEADVEAARDILTEPATGTPSLETGEHASHSHRCADCGLCFDAAHATCPACGTPANATIDVVRVPVVPEHSGRAGLLTSIRGGFRWVIWIWAAGGVLYIVSGLTLMLASMLRDVWRGTHGGAPAALGGIASLLALLGIAAATAMARSRRNSP